MRTLLIMIMMTTIAYATSYADSKPEMVIPSKVPTEIEVESNDVPTRNVRIDKKIKYRLLIDDYYVDVDCVREYRIDCDTSDIKNFLIVGTAIKIYKDKSMWVLFNYKDRDRMKLRVMKNGGDGMLTLTEETRVDGW